MIKEISEPITSYDVVNRCWAAGEHIFSERKCKNDWNKLIIMS
jgi:hypothetical protein